MTELDTLLEHFAYSYLPRTKRIRVKFELIDDDGLITTYQKELNVFNIIQLPIDLIFEISHYLTIKDLLNLSSVIKLDKIWIMRFNHDFIPNSYQHEFKYHYLRWFFFHFPSKILLGNIKSDFLKWQLADMNSANDNTIRVNHTTADVLLYHAKKGYTPTIIYQLLVYLIQYGHYDDFCLLYEKYHPEEIKELFIVAGNYRSRPIIEFFVKKLRPSDFDQLSCKNYKQIVSFLGDFFDDIIDLFSNKYHLLIHSLDENYMRHQLYFKIYDRIDEIDQKLLLEVWVKSFSSAHYLDSSIMQFIIKLIHVLRNGYKKLSYYIFDNLLRYDLWPQLKFNHHRAWVIRRHLREIEYRYRRNKFHYYQAFKELVISLNDKNQKMLWHWAKKKDHTIILDILNPITNR